MHDIDLCNCIVDRTRWSGGNRRRVIHCQVYKSTSLQMLFSFSTDLFHRKSLMVYKCSYQDLTSCRSWPFLDRKRSTAGKPYLSSCWKTSSIQNEYIPELPARAYRLYFHRPAMIFLNGNRPLHPPVPASNSTSRPLVNHTENRWLPVRATGCTNASLNPIVHENWWL